VAVRVLVLGGTVFVGRHVVETALARGDEVTILNRGVHPDPLPLEVERLVGDRDGDLSALAGRQWDSVVDTSGYFPRQVRATGEALAAGRVGHYTFVSSASVYADHSRAGTGEGAPLNRVPEDAPEKLSTPELYGGWKALSEGAAEEALPGRVLTVRAGLIVGPYDPTNRFTYWVTRLARGGEALAPEPRSQPVQLVDVRDLAAWILRSAETGVTGVLNATGPTSPLTLGELLERVRDALGGRAELVWADERFLVDAGVRPFTDLPLWLAPNVDPDRAGFLALDISRALAAGLRFRPLEETALDTLAWAGRQARPAKDVGVPMAPAGLTPERERELLAAWRREAA
jgi:2'-hydroxyisoflavone reductase